MSYDAWKLRAPEDEPGYWDDKQPECGDYYHDHQCLDCGKWESVCGACQRCGKCHDEEPRWPRCKCSLCGSETTRDPTYGDLCARCCRADNE